MPRSKIRVALFTDTNAPQVNGVAQTLERLSDAVRVRGGEVLIFTSADPNARDDRDVVRYLFDGCLRNSASEVSLRLEDLAFLPRLRAVVTRPCTIERKL